MIGYSQASVLGNATNAPELRTSPTGVSVTEIGVAVNEKRRDANGNAVEEVYFANCVFFGQNAEHLARYARVGTPLFVSGRLKSDEWTDKQTGQKRTKTKIVVDKFRILRYDNEPDGEPRQAQGNWNGNRQSQNGNDRPSPPEYRNAPQNQGRRGPELYSDEIPF